MNQDKNKGKRKPEGQKRIGKSKVEKFKKKNKHFLKDVSDTSVSPEERRKKFGKKELGKRPSGKSNPNFYDEELRLNRFLANAGICSRREADTLIAQGLVTVNGTVVTALGTKVKREDDVRYDGRKLLAENKVYILMNKPKDVVTTLKDPHAKRTVFDLIKDVCDERVYPVGRLDRNTTGVLLLTNDGELTDRLTHPKYGKKKIYHAFLDNPVSKQDLEKLLEGIKLEDGTKIAADEVGFVDEGDRRQVGLEIHSGQNRVVRRMFESIGYNVVKLDRVYFAGLTKKNVPRGKFRFLTEQEVNMLRMV